MPTLRVEQVEDDRLRIWVQVDCGSVLGGPHVAESLVFSGPTKDGEQIANELNQLFSPKPTVPRCCETCSCYQGEPLHTASKQRPWCTKFSFHPPSCFHFCAEWSEYSDEPRPNWEAMAAEALSKSPDFVVLTSYVYKFLQDELHGLMVSRDGERGPDECEHGSSKLDCVVLCECGHKCRSHVPLDIDEQTDKPSMPLCCYPGCRCGTTAR